MAVRRTTVLALGLLAAAALVAVVALTSGISLSFGSPYIEKRLTEILGRDVVLKRPPYLRVTRSIELDVGGLHIADAAWTGNASFLTVEQARVRIKTSSLLSQQILIEDLQLNGVSLDLAVSAEGKRNLPRLSGDDSEAPQDDASKTPRVILQHLTLGDIRIRQANAKTNRTIDFFIDALTRQVANEESIELRGAGTLQSRAWRLSGTGSNLASLREGKNLYAALSGEMDDIRLEASYRLADTDAPQDLAMTARLEGPVPRELSDLSPLLVAGEHLSVSLDVEDIDPGINLDLRVLLSKLQINLTGKLDHPGTGDGLALNVDLDSSSLPAVAAALGLGEVSAVPLSANATLSRMGRDIRLDDISIVAGDHRITGTTHVPEFPGTNRAALDLIATGPDFSLYQRLFDRPTSLEAPYEMRVHLIDDSQGAELVSSDLRIGNTVMSLRGRLGEFPGYKDSELELSLAGPNTAAVASNFGATLPEGPFDLRGRVHVSSENQITIERLRLDALALSANVTGTMNGYPDLNALDLNLEVTTPSAARTSEHLGLKKLPDRPATLSLAATGAWDSVSLRNLEIQAGDAVLESIDGALSWRDGALSSDVTLRAEIEDLSETLGAYAPRDLPSLPLNATVVPRFDDAGLDFTITALDAPGVSGTARLSLGPSYRVDEQTVLEADLRVSDIGLLGDAAGDYALPDTGLRVQATTEGGLGARTISASLRSNTGVELLLATVARDGDGISVAIRGEGDDLRDLGTFDGKPRKQQPYRADARGFFGNGQSSLTLQDITLAGTTMVGEVTYHAGDRPRLEANVHVPKGDLSPWLGSGDSEGTKSQKKEQETENSARLIPDTPLPLDSLYTVDADVRLTTGVLWVPDPLLDAESVIRKSALNYRSTENNLNLTIGEISGSRGTLRGTLTGQRSAGTQSFKADLNWRDFPVGVTSAGTSLDALPRHDVLATLSGHGETPHAVAASLDGEILLSGGAGTLQDMSISFATESFTAQLFNTLLPMLKSETPDMKVECTVLAAEINDGIVALNPGFVFRTQRVDLSARGEIDLETEAMAIRFDNQARKGFGLSAASLVNPYVQITGTLANPSLGLDITNSAIAGGAAVATGGLTVIAKPLYGRFLRRSNPCDVALKRWEDRDSKG
ncbi:MAG: hypothetical protein AAGG55_07070 [Pseudomonadota bacterium]